MQSTEKRATAANYVINFYNDILSLNHWYANYENVLLELEQRNKSKQGELHEIATENEKQTLVQYCETVRYFVTKSKITYITIMGALKKEPDNKIIELQEKIKKQYIVDRADLNEYVIVLNKVLVDNIIQDLLQSSADLLNELYNTENTQPKNE